MEKFSCVIIEDDPIFVEIMKNFITQTDLLELVGEADDSISAAMLISKLKPVVIFTDVMIPGLTGLEILEFLNYRPTIIVISGLEDIEQEVYKHPYVSHYVKKPITPQSFHTVLKKLSIELTGVPLKNSSRLPFSN